MATYSVHAVLSDETGEATRTIMVRDAFSLGALLLGPFWFLPQRMWLATSLWLSGLAGAIAIASLMSLPALAGAALAFVAFFLLALEFAPLRRFALRRRGYAMVDVTEGARIRDAEISYLARSSNRRLDSTSTATYRRSEHRREQGGDDGVGLFLQGTN